MGRQQIDLEKACDLDQLLDIAVQDDAEAIEMARLWFSYLPTSWRAELPSYASEAPAEPLTRTTVPEVESLPFDIHEVVDGLVDDDSFFEIKARWAEEIVTGLARLDGRVVGVVSAHEDPHSRPARSAIEENARNAAPLM